MSGPHVDQYAECHLIRGPGSRLDAYVRVCVHACVCVCARVCALLYTSQLCQRRFRLRRSCHPSPGYERPPVSAACICIAAWLHESVHARVCAHECVRTFVLCRVLCDPVCVGAHACVLVSTCSCASACVLMHAHVRACVRACVPVWLNV